MAAILESGAMVDVPRCYALVPCAGIGSRAGTGAPKQYALLAGRAVVAHTLAALDAVQRLTATLVVLAPDDAVFEAFVPGFAGPRAWVARRHHTCGLGGQRVGRAARARRARRRLGAGARCRPLPAATSAWVDRLIDACRGDEVGGLLALPLADTLKAAQGDRVTATLDRGGKWLAQTPQMFRLGLLQRRCAGRLRP